MDVLNEFQKRLSKDKDVQNEFVDSKYSDSDEEVELQLDTKKKSKGYLYENIFRQLIKQQNAYLKSQKKIYELKSEIDTEEVKTRYLKLDLNNMQLEKTELQESNKTLNKELYDKKLEILVYKALILLQFLGFIFYSFS